MTTRIAIFERSERALPVGVESRNFQGLWTDTWTTFSPNLAIVGRLLRVLDQIENVGGFRGQKRGFFPRGNFPPSRSCNSMSFGTNVVEMLKSLGFKSRDDRVAGSAAAARRNRSSNWRFSKVENESSLSSNSASSSSSSSRRTLRTLKRLVALLERPVDSWVALQLDHMRK